MNEKLLIIVVLSELLAFVDIRRVWRSSDHWVMCIALSVIALIPIFGPMLVLWINNFPEPQPWQLQDREPKSGDVLARWRHVLDEKNPHRKHRKWQEVMQRGSEDEREP